MTPPRLTDLELCPSSIAFPVPSSRIPRVTITRPDPFKRKPRRAHHTSEVSSPPLFPSLPPLLGLTIVGGDLDVDDLDEVHCDVDSTSPYMASHVSSWQASMSCPELLSQPWGLGAPARPKVGLSSNALGVTDIRSTTTWTAMAADSHCAQIQPLRSSMEFRRRRDRLSATMVRHLQSVGRRFRSSSSNYSSRPEFPNPPDARERRLLARDSIDIWPSSGDESPVYPTPEPDCSLNLPLCGTHIDPIARGGVTIATTGLEHISQPQRNSTRRQRAPGRLSDATSVQ